MNPALLAPALILKKDNEQVYEAILRKNLTQATSK